MSKVERRRSERKEVLETFHVFLVVPKMGMRKIYLKDVSTGGMGIQVEPGDRFTPGDVLPCEFYINPSLKLPLSLRVAHVLDEKVGCEFSDTSSRSYKAYAAFVNMLDQLAEFVE